MIRNKISFVENRVRAMDLCSIEEAFPNIDTGSTHQKWREGAGFPNINGTDSRATREERRAARKRAKKVKGPALTYSNSITPDLPPTDPDRPAVRRMEPVGTVQGVKEDSKMPVMPKASCLFSDSGTPSYFGNDGEDQAGEEEEGFSSFSATGGDNPNYVLQPDFTKTFDLKGVDKAGGELPGANTDDTWKPMTPTASYTAFVKDTSAPMVAGGMPGWSMNLDKEGEAVAANSPIPTDSAALVALAKKEQDDKDALMARINELMGRLENLEKKRTQDSQTEILMFVGTGLFLLISFDFMSRR